MLATDLWLVRANDYVQPLRRTWLELDIPKNPICARGGVMVYYKKENFKTALKNRVEYILKKHYKTSRPFSVEIHKKSSSLDSDVYLCKVGIRGEKPIRLYAKRAREEGLIIKHEYETMKHLWDRYYYKEGEMIIPKPIDYWENGATLFVERVKGRRLSRILGCKALPVFRWFFPTNLRELMNCAANWLAHFHSVTRKAKKISFNAAVQEDLKNISVQWPSVLGQKQIDKCFVKLRDFALNLDTTPHIITGRHGDYDPDNILMSSDRTCVIDFAYFSYGTPLLDVANFMVSLELHSTPVHTMSYHSLGFCRKLANDFLATYNRIAKLPFSKDEVNLYRVLKFIRALGYAKKAVEMGPENSFWTLLLRLQSMYAAQQIENLLKGNDLR